jgi:hypothetical protein
VDDREVLDRPGEGDVEQAEAARRAGRDRRRLDHHDGVELEPDPPDQGGQVVEVGAARAADLGQDALGPRPHGRQLAVGAVERRLLLGNGGGGGVRSST